MDVDRGEVKRRGGRNEGVGGGDLKGRTGEGGGRRMTREAWCTQRNDSLDELN